MKKFQLNDDFVIRFLEALWLVIEIIQNRLPLFHSKSKAPFNVVARLSDALLDDNF